jgi:hypothetical protein
LPPAILLEEKKPPLRVYRLIADHVYGFDRR